MTGAISRDWESCQFPFVLDEKATVVPVRLIHGFSRYSGVKAIKAHRGTAQITDRLTALNVL